MNTMFVHERAERLTRASPEAVKKLSISISIDVYTDPMFSCTVGRIRVAYYNRRSFLYTFWKSIARKHSHELSTTSTR